jgi:2',3'-cyclic-nucleotide 2'-phosphodiesterase/3'-nucleotidase
MTSQLLNSNTAPADPAVVTALHGAHDTVVSYVNAPIGTCTEEMLAARAVVEDVPIIDFVNYVQADAVKSALAGTAEGALPVLSIAAPFSRDARFPAGQVSVRDVAGLYIYDNTLLAVKVTGKDVKDYLEYSARYFQQVSGTGPFTMAQVTNASYGTAGAPGYVPPIPDYNFDTIAGLQPLAYDIDISRPVGSRIANLTYAGASLDPAMEFAMAVNNYRQGGGGGFPAVKTAPVVYNRQIDIRQLLIDWVTTNHIIDPGQFATVDWKLVSGTSVITVN